MSLWFPNFDTQKDLSDGLNYLQKSLEEKDTQQTIRKYVQHTRLQQSQLNQLYYYVFQVSSENHYAITSNEFGEHAFYNNLNLFRKISLDIKQEAIKRLAIHNGLLTQEQYNERERLRKIEETKAAQAKQAAILAHQGTTNAAVQAATLAATAAKIYAQRAVESSKEEQTALPAATEAQNQQTIAETAIAAAQNAHKQALKATTIDDAKTAATLGQQQQQIAELAALVGSLYSAQAVAIAFAERAHKSHHKADILSKRVQKAAPQALIARDASIRATQIKNNIAAIVPSANLEEAKTEATKAQTEVVKIESEEKTALLAKIKVMAIVAEVAAETAAANINTLMQKINKKAPNAAELALIRIANTNAQTAANAARTASLAAIQAITISDAETQLNIAESEHHSAEREKITAFAAAEPVLAQKGIRFSLKGTEFLGIHYG